MSEEHAHEGDPHPGNPNFAEREFETGSDEFFKAASGNLYNNMKRTYDEYQHESLADIRGHRTSAASLFTSALSEDNTRQAITNQCLQNAVETANLVGKQAVAHRDLAIDRMWNIDEVSGLSAKSGVQADRVSAMATAAVAAVLAAIAKDTGDNSTP